MGNSGPKYRGPLGQTSRQRILYVCPSGAEVSVEVFSQINADTDPELADELVAESGPPTVEDPETKERCDLHIERLFHDPGRQIFVLVLTDAHRHQEMQCRADLCERLADSPEATIPDYVRSFEVIYSGAEIADVLARRLESVETERARDEINERRAELASRESTLAAQENEFQNMEVELTKREGDVTRNLADIARERSELARQRSAISAPVASAATTAATSAATTAATSASATSTPAPAKPVAANPAPSSSSIDVVASTPKLVAKPSAVRQTQKGIPQVRFNATADAAAAAPAASGGQIPEGKPSNGVATAAASTQRMESSDIASTSPFSRIEFDEDGETYLEPAEPALEFVDDEDEEQGVVVADRIGSAPVASVDGSTRVGGVVDVAIERWISSHEPSLATIDEAGEVQLACSLPERSLEGLLSKELKVMLQLHSMATYPLVTLSVGTPEGFGKGRPAPATFHFNIDDTADRAVIEALAHDFQFQIDLFDTEYLPVRKRTVTAGLAPNAQYILSAADDALAKVRKRTEPSYTRALLAYDAPNYDRFGRLHPERKEFREDVLMGLSQASKVRWAIHVCRRFSAPEGQEYLFLTRGYPLRLWQSRRRAVIRRASELGLWMGNTLAGVAINEDIAGSRKELIETMARNFVEAVTGSDTFDLDEDTVRDNWVALTDELRVQGFDPGTFVSPRSEAISSELMDVASGLIGPVTALSLDPAPNKTLNNTPNRASDEPLRSASGAALSGKSTDELVALLGDRDRRYEAALELCRQSTPASARPLFSALRRMTRAEAGHVFGGVVSYGDVAVPHLIETLGSRKGFLRQGAALALAALGSEDGIVPVCELLVSEPTDIWKEVARALGEFGPRAVMTLCTQLRGGSEVAHERIAWALAHIASRGDRIDIDTLAGGRDPIAAGVAKHALELADLARSDNRSIWNPRPGREHTVKRAFSKRVFEAMPKSPRGEAERSSPAMALTDADLLEASELAEVDDDVEALDESDLLPN